MIKPRPGVLHVKLSKYLTVLVTFTSCLPWFSSSTLCMMTMTLFSTGTGSACSRYQYYQRIYHLGHGEIIKYYVTPVYSRTGSESLTLIASTLAILESEITGWIYRQKLEGNLSKLNTKSKLKQPYYTEATIQFICVRHWFHAVVDNYILFSDTQICRE